MPTTANPASADSCTPLQHALRAAIPVESFGADFKRGTWTFKIGPDTTVAAGAYTLLPQDAVREAVAQQSASNSSDAVLRAPRNVRVRFDSHDVTGLWLHGDDGFQVTLYRDYSPDPDASEWSRSRFNPAHWYGSETRHDTEGREWTAARKRYVQDDFGNLVAVQ